MSTVDELFERYRAAFRAGEASDPTAYLEQLEGDDRRELEALIDGFLARGARRPFEPDAFARLRADPLAQRIQASVAARMSPEESWQTVLPRARNQAQLLRADLVKRLAAALGVPGREEKVAGYYHAMETGSLDPAGVSDRVLKALGDIVGVSAESLRAAGRRLAPPAAPAAPTFARSAKRSAPFPARAEAAPAAKAPEWDEVDELFRGG